MSGKLVGEVANAREAGGLDMLSSSELLALIAIAEKCYDSTREGSVRRARIAAMMGREPRTASRAVAKLLDLKLVERVKAGYKSHDGDAQAAVYRLLPMPGASATQDGACTEDMHRPPRMTHANEGASATQDGACTEDMHAPNPNLHAPNGALASAKIGHASAIQDGNHDGWMTVLDDGLDDVGRTSGASATEQGYVTDARASETTPSPVPGSGDDDFPEKLARTKSRIVNRLERVGGSDARTLKDACSDLKPFYVLARRQLVSDGVVVEFSENGPGSKSMYRLASTDPWGP